MKVSIELESPEGMTFTPRSRVDGVLRIRGFAHRPARVRATLKGTLNIWASAQVYGSDSAQRTHTLFECHREIDPADLVQADQTKQPIYTSRVTFQLPAETRCETCGSCPLPPSLDATDSSISIKSEYFLFVTVDRYVVGWVTTSTRARQTLSFICDAPAVPTPSKSRSLILVPLQKLERGDLVTAFGGGNSPLPSYSSPSSSLQVDVILPHPPVLIRGRPTPIDIVINAPTDLLQRKDLYLRSVVMKLITSVAAGTDGGSWGVTVPHPGFHLSGRIRIEEERYWLDSGAWGSIFVVNSRPSFSSCLLRISHAVEVTVGVSRGLGDDVHYGLARVDVVVMDPPPTYDDSLIPQGG